MTDPDRLTDEARKARIHELKTWPHYFEAVLRGVKTFEVRKDDRDFQPGDTLHLREYHPEDGYSGRSIDREVTYCFRGFGELFTAEPIVVMALRSTPEAMPDGPTFRVALCDGCTFAEAEEGKDITCPDCGGDEPLRWVTFGEVRSTPEAGCDLAEHDSVLVEAAIVSWPPVDGYVTVEIADENGKGVAFPEIHLSRLRPTPEAGSGRVSDDDLERLAEPAPEAFLRGGIVSGEGLVPLVDPGYIVPRGVLAKWQAGEPIKGECPIIATAADHCEYDCEGSCEDLDHWKDRASYWYAVSESWREQAQERPRLAQSPPEATLALCRAGCNVRDGLPNWLKGAPTHVFAELVNALADEGWVVVPAAGEDE